MLALGLVMVLVSVLVMVLVSVLVLVTVQATVSALVLALALVSALVTVLALVMALVVALVRVMVLVLVLVMGIIFAIAKIKKERGEKMSNCGISGINGMTVYDIDTVPTIITKVKQVKGNVVIAKGFILKTDLTLEPCYIVKQDNLFAHGATIKEANSSLQEKLLYSMDMAERVEVFFKEFDLTGEYSAELLSEWHGKLTGSCVMGREDFMQRKGIKLEDKFTVQEFVDIAKSEYGSDIIELLEEELLRKGGK